MPIVISGSFRPAKPLGATPFFPTVADFNGDGLLEPLGLINNGDGTFKSSPTDSINLLLAPYTARAHRDNRVFDVDGDGDLDIFWNVYSSPQDTQSFALIIYGDGLGGFTHIEERRDINGYGETIVTADFNNDGHSDIYSPVYTHVDGNDAGFLLFNNNGVLGSNLATEWNVGLSNLSVFYRVEGAQAADVNFDGLIDMFVGSHLFINTGTNFDAQRLSQFTFEEGANLVDYDNDGDFDLVLRPLDFGPQLFENINGVMFNRGIITGDVNFGGFGSNVADLDNNGWMDIVFATQNGLTVLFNSEGEFTRYDLNSTINSQAFDSLAVGDLNGDGRLDILARTNAGQLYVFENDLVVGKSISLSVRGPTGELNQHGRSVTLAPQDQSQLIIARVVDGGSGYLSQGQYDLNIGLPIDVAYDVTVYFAGGPLAFVASASQNIQVYAGVGVSINGTSVDDRMGGSLLADVLSGAEGDDLFLGSAGADSIDGGAGTDTFDWSAFATAISADLSLGTIILGGAVQTVANVEKLIGTAFADSLTGNAAINMLYGGGGNDILVNNGDGDTLLGEAGDDTYIVSSDSTVVVEQAGGGLDTVMTATLSYELPDFVENLNGVFEVGQQLTGNSLNNRISGGVGSDVFRGGEGHDVYIVGDGDRVEELDGEGIDEVRTALSAYSLPDFIENITGTSDLGQILTGNTGNNNFSGGAGADVFVGGQGDDFYNIDTGDTAVELNNGGKDTVTTSLSIYVLEDNIEWLIGTAGGTQSLTGNMGDNLFSAISNNATFFGLGGNDVYYVKLNQSVSEKFDNGIDEVVTSLAVYILPQHVENLTATGINGQKLVGNDLSNILTGSINIDTLIGRAGDDVYIIQNELDFIQDDPNAGFDTVRTTVSYGLFAGAAIERLESFDANGTSAMNLFGNAFAQTIRGNNGNNLLIGGGGGDTLIGLGGDDTYAIDNTNDVVLEVENGGYDRVASFASYTLAAGSHVELLYARDITSLAGITLTGNELAQTIYGNAGNNTLIGGGGGDTLRGFGGDDVFRYLDASDSSSTAFDRLIEFDDEADKIDLPFTVSSLAPEMSGNLNFASFDLDLQVALLGLGANQAGVFKATGGDVSGRTFLVIDANGVSGYQANADYVIEIVAPITPLDQIDIFI